MSNKFLKSFRRPGVQVQRPRPETPKADDSILRELIQRMDSMKQEQEGATRTLQDLSGKLAGLLEELVAERKKELPNPTPPLKK